MFLQYRFHKSSIHLCQIRLVVCENNDIHKGKTIRIVFLHILTAQYPNIDMSQF